MLKKQILFISIGIIVAIIAVYFAFRTTPENSNKTPNVPVQSSATIVTGSLRHSVSSPEPTQVIKASKGQKVSLQIISETADSAHLHGYDISVDLVPNVQATLEFVATETGRFGLETHESDKVLAYIEVSPN